MAITAQQFRSEMILKVRAFDAWAYKDELASPGEYSNYDFQEWFELFTQFTENES